MTIDLNAPEIKDAIKAAVEEATSGLVKKRDELLNEVKTLRAKTEIKPEDYNKLREENEQLKEAAATNDKALKKAGADLEALKKAHESEAGYVSQLLIDNGLTDALAKAGVKPELAKAVKAMFAGRAQIKVDGNNRSAIIDEKSLSDFISDWAKSDEGKHFVAAPLNVGGGANGGSGSAGSKTMSRSEYNALAAKNDFASIQKFFAEGGSLTE